MKPKQYKEISEKEKNETKSDYDFETKVRKLPRRNNGFGKNVPT